MALQSVLTRKTNVLNDKFQSISDDCKSFSNNKTIHDKTIREADMQHNAKHPHDTVKNELDIVCHTARRPHIAKSDSNIEVKSSNIIDPIHSTSPDLPHTDHVDQQDEADYDQSFLSSFEHITDNEHHSYDDKIPDPAMKGAAIPSQLH
eukprot:1373740-Ditylum_brightwellii.AAC.1